MPSLRVVFMGTPDFAVPALRKLSDVTDLILVVTQPDRKAGRGRKMTPPPVKVEAMNLGLEVLQPEKTGSRVFRDHISRLEPDLIVTVAYGKILKKRVLDIPEKGCINVHASLLPKYRGAAPVNWALIRGEKETGVSIMQMDEGLDTGPVLMQESIPVGPDETAGEVHDSLSDLGSRVLLKTIEQIDALVPTPQDDAVSSYAPKLSREDCRIDWNRTAAEVHNRVRGLSPKPGAFTFMNNCRLQILRSTPVSMCSGYNPGDVTCSERGNMTVACREGGIELIEIKPAGKRSMRCEQFLAGRQIRTGMKMNPCKDGD